MRRPSTIDKESRAFTAEVTGIPAKRLRKAPSVFFLAPSRLGREGFVCFNTTADGLAGWRAGDDSFDSLENTHAVMATGV